AAAGAGDRLHGRLELLPAVALERAQDLPGQALRVDPGQDRLAPRDVALHHREVLLVVTVLEPVHQDAERPVVGGDFSLGVALSFHRRVEYMVGTERLVNTRFRY